MLRIILLETDFTDPSTTLLRALRALTGRFKGRSTWRRSSYVAYESRGEWLASVKGDGCVKLKVGVEGKRVYGVLKAV